MAVSRGGSPSELSPGRRPGSAAALSSTEILKAGLALGVRDGFDALSMRSVARELGVTPMAIYHYVANKEALQQLLIDTVLSQVIIPPPEFGDWQQRLLELQRRSGEALGPYPGLELLIFDAKPPRETKRLINGYIQILLDGGFTERQAILGFSVVHAHTLGRYVMEGQLRAGNYVAEDSDTDGPLDLGHVWSYWAEDHASESRDFSSRVILRGLTAILESSPGTAAGPAWDSSDQRSGR